MIDEQKFKQLVLQACSNIEIGDNLHAPVQIVLNGKLSNSTESGESPDEQVVLAVSRKINSSTTLKEIKEAIDFLMQKEIWKSAYLHFYVHSAVDTWSPFGSEVSDKSDTVVRFGLSKKE